MGIVEFLVFGNKIYLNPENGDISDNKCDLENSQFKLIKENYINSFKATSYAFCLNISDSCNLNCSYCFNQNKDSIIMKLEDALQYFKNL